MNAKTRITGMLVVLPLLGLASQACAYCVTNKTDRTVHVQQVTNDAGSAFKEWLDPGSQKCCNWKTHDCNKSKGKTDPVGFDAYVVEKAGLFTETRLYLCQDYRIPANGDLYLVIEGTNLLTCSDHYP